MLLRTHPPSDLREFMHAVASKIRLGSHRPTQQPTDAAQWSLPLPVPFAEVLALPRTPMSLPTSGRRRSRYFREQNFKVFVNFVVLAMNWLHFGRPRNGACSEHVPLAWSSIQFDLAQPLLGVLRAWYRSSMVCVDDQGMPVLDGGLSRLVASLSSVAGAYGNCMATDQGALSQSMETVQLSAASMSLPKVAGRVPLRWPLIPPEVEQLIEDPKSFMHPEAPLALPRTFTAVDDWLTVLDALLNCELCELIPEHLVPRHFGCRVSAGLFGVPKKGSTKTRLIIDRRAQNSREVGLKTALAGLHVRGLISLESTLPYPAQFCRLLLGDTSTWSVCSEDVADYYYLMRLPWACQVTNVLGPPVCAAHVEPGHVKRAQEKWGPYTSWAAAVVAPAMGDQKAPELAQLAHAHLLQEHGVFRERHMVYGDGTPRSNIWQSVYIDDYCQLSLMDSRMSGAFGVAEATKAEAETLHEARSCYSTSGLIRKESKAVTCAQTSEIWGVELNGAEKTVAVSREKRHLLVLATVRVLRRQWVNPDLVQKIVGHWCYVFSMKRSLMCLLQYTYGWLRHPQVEGRVRCRLPRRIRDELLLLCAFAWSAFTQCDLLPSRTIYASDATIAMGAVVACTLSPAEALWVWLQTDTQAVPMLYQGDRAAEMFLLLQPLASRELVERWAAAKDFHVRAVFSFRESAHINKQELLAWRCALRSSVRKRTALRSRAVFLIDSQVVTNIIRKGRSSSRSLNHILGTCLPLMLLGQVIPEPLWIRSAANPADDPTRGVRLRHAGPPDAEVEQELADLPRVAPWPWAVCSLAWNAEGPEFHGHLGRLAFNPTCGYPGEGPAQRRTPSTMNANLDHHVLASTAQRYSVRVDAFNAWLTSQKFPVLAQLVETEQFSVISETLAAYVQLLYNSQQPISFGTWTLAGCQYFHPCLRHKLDLPWARQRQWARLAPLQMRAPMPRDVMLALALTAWLWSWQRTSLGILIGYQALLRPAEIVALKREDIVLPCDMGGEDGMAVLSIRHSKTTSRAARLQSAFVDDDTLVLLLQGVCAHDHPRATFLAGGLRSFNQKFEALRKHLELEHSPFTPATLRSGGATWYIRRTQSLSMLQWKGRWSSERSVQHYLQLNLGAVGFAALPSRVKEKIHSLAHYASIVLDPRYVLPTSSMKNSAQGATQGEIGKEKLQTALCCWRAPAMT
eukprot:6252250-Amphidinium_carterae.2